MSTLDSNLIVWRLEYFALHRLAIDNGLDINHNNRVGDLASVRRLLYSLVRKILTELLITPIDINGAPTNDSLSKSHGDLSFALSLDSSIIMSLDSIVSQLASDLDADMLAFNVMLDVFQADESLGTTPPRGRALISMDRINNSISFNVGKTCFRGRERLTSPNTVAFLEQLLVFAPIWQRLRIKIQHVFDQSDVAQQLQDNTVDNLTGSPFEKFKKLLVNRRQARDSQ